MHARESPIVPQKEPTMTIGRKWSVKLAVCAVFLVLALAGKVLSQDKPAPRARRGGARAGPAALEAGPERARPPAESRDVTAKEAGKPTIVEIAEAVGHNKIAINIDVDARHRLPGHVHAGGLRAGRDRLHPGQERGPHHDDELHGLRDRHDRLLDLGFALQMGGVGRGRHAGRHRRPRQRVHDQPLREGLRPVRDEGLLPRRHHATTSASSRCSSSRWCSWTRRRRSRPARWPSAGSSRPSSSTASSSR